MLRSNNMARAVGRAFSSTYSRLEKAAIAAARRNDAMLLYVPDNPSNVLQFSAGYTPSLVGSPVGRLMDMQYGTPTLGPEMAVNGGFDTDSGWNKGVNVTISGGLAVSSGLGASGVHFVSQLISLQAGKTYRFSYTINRVSGTGGLSLQAGSVVGSMRTASGTYVETFTLFGTGALYVMSRGDGGFVGSIDNISVREVIEAPMVLGGSAIANGDFSAGGTGWSAWPFTTGTITIDTGAAVFDNVGPAGMIVTNTQLSPGKSYLVTYTLSGVVAGSIRPESTAGGYIGVSRWYNGTYSEVIAVTGSGGGFALKAATTFTGTVDNISVREIISMGSRSPELVVNGAMTSWSADNPVGWSLSMTETASEYVTQAAGGLRLVSSSGNFAEAFQNICVVGKTYEAIVEVTACAGTGSFSNTSLVPFTFTSPGIYRAVFTAVGTSVGVKRGSPGVAVDFTIGSISVKEVYGYHCLQTTAANKPTIARIPRKRGVELIVNGSFDSDLNGWGQGNTGASTVTWSAGQALFNTNGVDGARLRQQVSVTPGKTYWVSCYATPSLSTALGTSPGGAELTGYMSGSVGFAYTAVGTSFWLNTVTVTNGVTLDNVSVREVLEWSNAVQIDGTDDWMDVTFRDYFAGGSYTFVGAWTGPVTGNSSFVLAQSNTSDVDPLCSPLFVPSGSNHVSIFERGDTAQVGISGSSYSLDTLQGSACVELLQTSGGGTGNYKGWRGGALVRNINYTRVVESLTTNKVTLGASQRTSVSGFAKGTFALLCWSANVMPDADRRDIGRFASYLIGEPYV